MPFLPLTSCVTLNKPLLRPLIKSAWLGVSGSPGDPWVGCRGCETPEIVCANVRDPNVHLCLVRVHSFNQIDLVTIVYLKGEQSLYEKQNNSHHETIQISAFRMVCSFPAPVTHHP